MKIGDEGQRGLEVLLDDVESQLKGGKPIFNVVELAADSLLFDPEKIERDRIRVVGFEELRPFIQGTPLTGNELLSLDASVLAELGDLLENDLFCLEPEVFAELDALVDVDDLFFDALDEHRPLTTARRIALATDADEVGIDAAGATLGIGDDQARATVDTGAMLLSAEDRALEVVVMNALLLAGEVVGFQQPLYFVKRLLVDQRLVLSGVLDAPVANDADVIRVLEHLVECRDGDGPSWPLGGRLAQKAALRDLGKKRSHRPLAGGVRLERPDD